MSAVEIGKIVDGVVTGITNFGAFVQLPDGKTGLCHISEIADSYVKSVTDHLTEAQPVKVKIISVDEKGKVSLSIRQAAEKSEASVVKASTYSENGAASAPSYPPRGQSKPYTKNASGGGGFNKSSGGSFNKSAGSSFNKTPGGFNKSAARTERRPDSLEDMISGFLKDSDDKLKSFKKAGKSTRKGNGYNNKAK
jgi:S1 RNA binding domain protein